MSGQEDENTWVVQIVRDNIRPAVPIEIGNFKIAALKITLCGKFKSHCRLRFKPVAVIGAVIDLPVCSRTLDDQIRAPVAIEISTK